MMKGVERDPAARTLFLFEIQMLYQCLMIGKLVMMRKNLSLAEKLSYVKVNNSLALHAFLKPKVNRALSYRLR